MIASVLGKRAFAAILRNLEGRIDQGVLTLGLPDGTRHTVAGVNPGPEAHLQIHTYGLMRRILRFGSLGFAEAYMAEECSSPDMRAVMDFAVANARWFDSSAFMSRGLANLVTRWRHSRRDNSRLGSRKNIAHHYDLGNAFYALWLDPSMTYSSAVFADGVDSLEAAQREKYARLAQLADLKPGARVLEVGCGWGGFAEFAAKEYGAEVTGLTISQEQLDYARARIARAGLSAVVDLQFCDYREHKGQDYDAFVSIEMFEAVGERHWRTFFDRVQAFLRPGGKAALQIITIAEPFFEDYRASPDFIQKYIFPGGMLPTPEHLDALAGEVNLTREASTGYGSHYARTLDTWLANFRQHWDQISALGFDERFRRMWEYYLHYCAAGFTDGRLDVRQIGLRKAA